MQQRVPLVLSSGRTSEPWAVQRIKFGVPGTRLVIGPAPDISRPDPVNAQYEADLLRLYDDRYNSGFTWTRPIREVFEILPFAQPIPTRDQ
jgi:hypothetical protein